MEMREIINIIEEQQMIAELLAEKKLGKLGKAMATLGAIGSLATASPGVAGDEVAMDTDGYNKNSTSSAVKVADGPGEVAPAPAVDDKGPSEVAPSQFTKNANGILVMKDGSPVDYDSWENLISDKSLETTSTQEMKQDYLNYVKSVQGPGSARM